MGLTRCALLPLLVLALAGCDGSTPAPLSDGGAPLANRSEPAAYIRGDAHPRLVIELDVVDGYAPRAGVEDAMLGALIPLLDKPGGIRVAVDGTIPATRAQAEWTFADLQVLAEEQFGAIGAEDEAVLHTLWLSGTYRSESGGAILGVAWANRYVAMFADTIEQACSAALPVVRDRLCVEAEAAVWAHEVGHVIGLVDNGIPMAMDHEDPEHPGHTSDEDGLMYWAYERASVVDLLAARIGSGSSFAFGPASIADVEAFRDNP